MIKTFGRKDSAAIVCCVITSSPKTTIAGKISVERKAILRRPNYISGHPRIGPIQTRLLQRPQARPTRPTSSKATVADSGTAFSADPVPLPVLPKLAFHWLYWATPTVPRIGSFGSTVPEPA